MGERHSHENTVLIRFVQNVHFFVILQVWSSQTKSDHRQGAKVERHLKEPINDLIHMQASFFVFLPLTPHNPADDCPRRAIVECHQANMM